MNKYIYRIRKAGSTKQTSKERYAALHTVKMEWEEEWEWRKKLPNELMPEGRSIHMALVEPEDGCPMWAAGGTIFKCRPDLSGCGEITWKKVPALAEEQAGPVEIQTEFQFDPEHGVRIWHTFVNTETQEEVDLYRNKKLSQFLYQAVKDVPLVLTTPDSMNEKLFGRLKGDMTLDMLRKAFPNAGVTRQPWEPY